MKINNSLQSGSLFLRNFLLGIFLIIATLIAFTFFRIGDEYSTILSGFVLLLINILVVLIYTKAVLSNEEILAQEDSSDLAYYLGFCLTVTTLALSFGMEALRQPFSKDAVVAAAESSNLIKGSLIQFAAGLCATLAGLCAKIYITSEQSQLVAEPEELYRQFRQEIYGFQTEIKGAVNEITSSFKIISNGLIQSADQTGKSIDSFLKSIDESTKQLNTTFDSIKLDKFAISFNENVQKLQDSVGILATEMLQVSSEIATLSKNSTDLNSSFVSITSNVSKVDIELNNFYSIIHNLTSKLNASLELFSNFENTIQVVNKSVTSFDNSISNTSEKLIIFSNQSLLNYTNQVNGAADQTALLIERNQKYISHIDLLISNFDKQIKTNENLNQSQSSLISSNEKIVTLSNEVAVQIDRISNSFITLSDQISKVDLISLNNSLDQLKNTIIPTSNSFIESKNNADKYGEATRRLEENLNQYSQRLDTIISLHESLRLNINSYSESFNRLSASINSLPSIINSVEQSLTRVNRNIS